MSTFAKPVSYGPSSAADPNEGRSFGGAFWLSAIVHVLLLGLLLYLTVMVSERAPPQTKIFELVAGEGSDFMATEAPAGDPAGQAATGEITFTSPEVPTMSLPAPDPGPAAPPEPPPTPVSPVEPAKPVKPEPVTPPVPNFTKQINRKIANEKKKADKEIQKQREADARAAKERELAGKRLSYDEYTKSNSGKGSGRPSTGGAAGGSSPGPRVDAKGIKKGVLGGTGAGSQGAGGTALSAAAEGAALERYFSMLRSRLRENHEKPGGLSDLLNAEVQFTLAADGSISGVRIVRSSGNADFDQSVVEAFARVRMPARPDGKTDSVRLVFRMKEIDAR